MSAGFKPELHQVPVPPMRWDAWGDPELAAPLSEGTSTLIRGMLGVSGEITLPALDPSTVTVSPSRLTDADLAGLRSIVGDGFASAADADRLLRAGGIVAADGKTAAYDAILASSKGIPAAEIGTADAPESALTLSAVERDMARAAGLTEAEFVAQKAADLGLPAPKSAAA